MVVGKEHGLTLGLRTVFLYLPQPVAACMIVLPPGGSLPALAQVTLPVHPPHPFTYLAASWKVDVEHTPAPDFTRWYMSRVTCGTFLLEVCQRCKVCSNLVAHLQIPRMRISYQVAMPVVGKPGQHAVPRRPDGAFGEALLSQGWCPRQVLQMPRERSQPLVQEIPLALRQSHATVLPVASPLLQDHDVVQSLHFYFLLARTPLSDAEVGHLTSPNQTGVRVCAHPQAAHQTSSAAASDELGCVSLVLAALPPHGACHGCFGASGPCYIRYLARVRTQEPLILQTEWEGTQGPQ